MAMCSMPGTSQMLYKTPALLETPSITVNHAIYSKRPEKYTRRVGRAQKETTHVLIGATSSIRSVVGVGQGKHTVREGYGGEGIDQLEFERSVSVYKTETANRTKKKHEQR